MANQQLTEEQLQQSAVLSDEDAEYEDARVGPAKETLQNTDSPLTNPNIHNDDLSEATGDEGEERGLSAVEEDIDMGENTDDHSDLSEEESLDEDMDHNSDEDVDAHLEQDNGDGVSTGARSRSSSPLDDIEEDEAEGVGAVKIRPGETDDEEMEDLESEHSGSQSDFGNESDGAAAWEDIAGEDEDDEEEEEGSEDPAPNTCMFCKQDEEHDPGEDFEEYLTCIGCGENCK